MPIWAYALLILLQEAPALAAGIDLATAPATDEATMRQLIAARDLAIAAYAAKLKTPNPANN